MHKFKLCSTYGYIYISISSVTPTGDLNKYKSAISISISSVTPTGDMNMYKSAISASIGSVVLTGASIQV